MKWGLDVSTAPTAEPISTAEAKTHLRVTVSTDDTYIDTLIASARHWVEQHCGIALIDQTLKLYLDRFPICDEPIMLPRPPSQTISSVTYVDEDGTTQTWTSSKYALDAIRHPGRLHTAYNETYPTVRSIENAVIVTYVAGYGATGASVPPDIIHAMKLLLTQWYEVRESVCPTTLSEPPYSVKALLGHYRTYYRGPIMSC